MNLFPSTLSSSNTNPVPPVLPPLAPPNPSEANLIQRLFLQATDPAIPKEQRNRSFSELLDSCFPQNENSALLQKIRTASGDTLVTFAIQAKENEWTSRLIRYPSLCLEKDSQGNTPLHQAAIRGDSSLFLSLCRINGLAEPNEQGETALHLAIKHGHTEIILSLMEQKLLPAELLFLTEEYALNLLCYAAFLGQTEIFAHLLTSSLFAKQQWTQGLGNPLHVAIFGNQIHFPAYLQRQHPLLFQSWGDQQNELGLTPLHLAALHGRDRCILLLHEHFPRTLELADKKGKRPVFSAALALNHSTVKLIVILGCKAEYFFAALDRLRETSQPEVIPMIHFMENLQSLVNTPNRREAFKAEPIRWLALAGGGQKGPGEIGALIELEQLFPNIEGISGTSIGAINGALLAVGYSPRELEKIFSESSFADLMDIEHLDGKQLSDLVSGTGQGLSLGSVFREIGQLVRRPLTHAFTRAQQTAELGQLVSNLFSLNGIFSGEKMRKWIEELIFQKTGVQYLTFGELAAKSVGKLSRLPVKHLFISITSLQPRQLICMNTIDPEWKDHIISDAARASASFPGAFQPHAGYIKAGTERLIVSNTFYADGGMLSNRATRPLDERRFIKKETSEVRAREPQFNPSVLALRFLSVDQLPQLPTSTMGFKSFISSCINYYQHAENVLDSSTANDSRTILIPVDISAMTVASPEKIQQLLESGKKAVRDFFAEKEKSRQEIWGVTSDLCTTRRHFKDPRHGVPPRLSSFSGRFAQLEQLKLLTAEGNSKPILIYGSEGMGKTVLVTEYAHQNKYKFDLTWLIDCHDPDQFADSYRSLGWSLGLNIAPQESIKTVCSKVHQKLSTFEKPWLLIFDDLSEIPRELPQGGSVLFVSRKNLDSLSIGERIEVRSFELSEVEELVEKQLKSANRQLALKIQQKNHSHPNDIEQMVRRMAQSNIPYEEFLHQSQPSLKVSQSLIDLSTRQPAAYEFLSLLLYVNSVPLSFLTHWLEVNKRQESAEKILDQLTSESRITYTPQADHLRIRTKAAEELLIAYKQNDQEQNIFNQAFQALSSWKAKSSQESIVTSWKETIVKAVKQVLTTNLLLWEQLPSTTRFPLLLIVGDWYFAQPNTFEEKSLGEMALQCYQAACKLSENTEEQKLLRFKIELLDLAINHKKIFEILKLGLYFNVSKNCLSFCANLTQRATETTLARLCDKNVIKSYEKCIQLQNDTQRLLMRESAFFLEEMNQILAHLIEWINSDLFKLETDGEACVQNAQILKKEARWQNIHPQLRAEIFYQAALWQKQSTEETESAQEMYNLALELCQEETKKALWLSHPLFARVSKRRRLLNAILRK